MISGLQVDAWGAFVPNRAGLVDQIKASVIQEVQSRGIEDLEITTQNLGVGTT